MTETRNQFIAIVIITIACAYVVAPIKDKPMPGFLKDAVIKKGIDIAGGAELKYRLLFPPGFTGDRSHAAQQVVGVLQNRINTKGLKEPRITTHGDEFVVVQLAGVDRNELDDYKRLIGDVGNLELKKVATKEVHERYNADKITPDGYEKHPPSDRSDRGAYPWIQDTLLINKEPVIIGQDVDNAYHEPDIRHGKGGWKINFVLKDEGAKKFDDAAAELFGRNPHGQIAIIIDGILKSAPVVQAPAFGGHGEITGSFDENSAKDLGIVLRSGSLPVPIGRIDEGRAIPKEPEAENFVGPSLGQDAILRGLLASVAACVGVALFMIIYYRAGGIIAVISLALNLIYLMAIMAFFGATLTLPGIAGIALTAGMAVDANILIYERIREELAKGKTLLQAFESGHERAFTTIVDANVTTLIAGIVLYYFGTGPVQGFAITLSVGILTTLVTVLWCSKVFLHMLISGGSITEMKMMHIFTKPSFDFVKWTTACAAGSLLVIVGTMAVFAARGEKNFGIDFRGGSMLNFALNETGNIQDVRDRIHGVKDAATGLPRYPDAEVMTIAEPGANIGDIKIVKGASRMFQLRDRSQNVRQLSQDMQELFKNELSHVPFEEILPPSPEIPPDSRYFVSGPAGAGLFVYLRDDGKFNLEPLRKSIVEAMRGILDKDPNTGEPEITVEQKPDAPKGLIRLKLIISQRDYEREAGARLRRVREAIKTMGANKTFTLSTDPFLAQGSIGPTVAQELKTSSIWAMIVSWILMIGYIAIRFSSWRFGVAAVMALIHDALISIGFIALLGAVAPLAWGLSFDMNMTFVAAILTIIGYSINDTIVVYDRIRENLTLMKKETFREIINTSVNQTMSRTILTSLTVLITSVILYIATMTSGGGIAEFSLPMTIGVITGTYSSIYIAAPIVLWWYGKTKPQLA